MKSRFNLLENVKTISEFRDSVASSIEHLRNNKQPLVVTQQGKPAAVMLDVESFNKLTKDYDVIADILNGLNDSIAGKTYTTENLKEQFKQNGRID